VGHYAYVAKVDGLGVIDIDVSTNPEQVGEHVLSTWAAKAVEVQDGYAYVAAGYRYDDPQDSTGGTHLRIVDVTEATNPNVIGGYDGVGGLSASDIDVYGTRAYVAYGGTRYVGCDIIDVSNKANPIELGAYGATLPGPDYYPRVRAQGNWLYITDRMGFRVLDVTEPNAPVQVDTYQPADWVSDLFLLGGHAYVAAGLEGLTVVSVVDPTNLDEVGTCIEAVPAEHVHVAGDHAYVTRGDDLLVINVEELSIPRGITPMC